jgi:hypothetical protein
MGIIKAAEINAMRARRLDEKQMIKPARTMAAITIGLKIV